MALPYIIGAAGAASSLISDIIAQSDAKKAKKRAYDAYAKLLRSNTEILTRADRHGDNFYTKAMNELNEGAFAARGALNPGMLKTIAYSKMAAARSGVEAQSQMTDENYNEQIRAKLAEIDATPIPSINPINAITAGVEGYFAGRQLDMTEELMKAQGEYYKKLPVFNNSYSAFNNPYSLIDNNFVLNSDIRMNPIPKIKLKLGI